ncbi:hypothetical protein H1S01_07500 [Heliobacterium chlorum]|uniref:Uncharacterized protein n=1 Tax=Heliobacterium chlorum TaxID=2698 RepID=A0ABR7T0M5_HELCL|nr:hypothetical protein [Heliobacterium chlorum]MBC9784355.1 hypothetical protein [Heliobacterium chlorum]
MKSKATSSEQDVRFDVAFYVPKTVAFYLPKTSEGRSVVKIITQKGIQRVDE